MRKIGNGRYEKSSQVCGEHRTFVVFGWLKKPLQPSNRISIDSEYCTKVARANLESALVSKKPVVLYEDKSSYRLMVAKKCIPPTSDRNSGKIGTKKSEQAQLRRVYEVTGEGKEVYCIRLLPKYNPHRQRYYWVQNNEHYRGTLEEVQEEIAYEVLGIDPINFFHIESEDSRFRMFGHAKVEDKIEGGL